MSSYTLFVSPGIREGDAAVAKQRYDGDGDKDDFLDQARIRAVADALIREHRLKIDSEDEEGQGGPRGLDLLGDTEDENPNVRVDCWGVAVALYGADALPALPRLVAVARTASRLLGGAAVYDAERDVIVDLSRGETEVLEAATKSLSRPGVSTDLSLQKGKLALIVFIAAPLLLLTVARRFLSGFPLFLAVFGTMAAAAFFASWSARRPVRRATPPAPGAPFRAAAPKRGKGSGFDDRPIKPG